LEIPLNLHYPTTLRRYKIKYYNKNIEKYDPIKDIFEKEETISPEQILARKYKNETDATIPLENQTFTNLITGKFGIYLFLMFSSITNLLISLFGFESGVPRALFFIILYHFLKLYENNQFSFQKYSKDLNLYYSILYILHLTSQKNQNYCNYFILHNR
jgi:hypothetical protein